VTLPTDAPEWERAYWERQQQAVVPEPERIGWQGDERLRDRLVPIDSLPAYAVAEVDLERLSAALLKYGQVRPVLVDASGGIVGRGHLIAAAVALGWTHIATRLEAGEQLASEDRDQMSFVDEIEQNGNASAAELAALAANEKLEGQVSEVGVAAINDASADTETEWVGLPEFVPVDASLKLVVSCETEETRDALLDLLGIATIHKGTRGTLSVWWPDRAKYDLASLRFQVSE
jgi:hypothetical protein